MVTTLRFKGDRPKSKKRKSTSTAGSSRPKPPTPSDLEGWTSATTASDLTGPITLRHGDLHLSCDALGAIFSSPAAAEDGEPASVQQVFTVAPIYGADPESSKYSVRSHAGRYVSVDGEGRLKAVGEAIGVRETFVVRVEEGGGWSVRACDGRFVGVGEDGSVAAVYDGVRVWSMACQMRFKVVEQGEGVGVVVKERIGRRELERLAGVELDDEQVRILRRAKRDGGLNEALLDVRVKKGKHDKFAY